MSKHEIEVEGLPDGWEPVAYRYPKNDEHVFLEGKIRNASEINKNYEQLIVKKKHPRRIVLEETDEENIKHDNAWCVQHFCHGLMLTQQPKRWREVKETEEPKLCLSVEECKSIMDCDFLDVVHKVKKFLININKTY